MHKNSRIYIIISLVVIMFIAICVVYIENNQNRKSSMKLDLISNQSNIITFSDKLPINDDVGRYFKYNDDNAKVQGFYQFVITNNNDHGTFYEIYVDMGDYPNLVHSNFIKVFLTDGDDNPVTGFNSKSVPTIYKLKNSSSSVTGKRLFRGYIKPKESKEYILRSWVGDAYSIGSYEKEIKFDVNVEVD